MVDDIKINTFLANMLKYDVFSKVRHEAFPASSHSIAPYGTPALDLPSLLVEVETIAIIISSN